MHSGIWGKLLLTFIYLILEIHLINLKLLRLLMMLGANLTTIHSHTLQKRKISETEKVYRDFVASSIFLLLIPVFDLRLYKISNGTRRFNFAKEQEMRFIKRICLWINTMRLEEYVDTSDEVLLCSSLRSRRLYKCKTFLHRSFQYFSCFPFTYLLLLIIISVFRLRRESTTGSLDSSPRKAEGSNNTRTTVFTTSPPTDRLLKTFRRMRTSCSFHHSARTALTWLGVPVLLPTSIFVWVDMFSRVFVGSKTILMNFRKYFNSTQQAEHTSGSPNKLRGNILHKTNTEFDLSHILPKHQLGCDLQRIYIKFLIKNDHF